MSKTSKSQAARRLGSISAVPAVQARVRDHVIVPNSSVVTRRSTVPLKQQKKISPLHAFTKGVALSFRDIIMAPFENTTASPFKKYIFGLFLFAGVPLAVSTLLLANAPIQENLRLLGFLLSNVAVFLCVSALTVAARALKKPLKHKVASVMQRGRQS